MNETIYNSNQLSTSLSIDTLQEIVRNYERNEQYIRELIHSTRHERKKAEHILHEIYQTLQECDKQISTSSNTNSKLMKLQKSIEFFVCFNDNNTTRTINHDSPEQNNKNPIQNQSSFNKTILKEQDKKSRSSILNKSIHSIIDNTHRVRFNIPEKKNDIQTHKSLSSSYQQKQSTTMNDKLSELARRCEDLLSCLHIHRNQVAMKTFKNRNYNSKQTLLYPQYNQTIIDQQTQKFLRPKFISHSRQHINLLHKKNKHNSEIDHKCQQVVPLSHSNLISYHTNQTNFIRLPLTYKEELKSISMKNYEQFNNRLQQNLKHEIQQRNILRSKIFQIRLRQHALLHGRINDNESLMMIDI
ncbi:unnamed protein product [Rotaria sordida]|uniref:Uncharacterized protein n=1 Tax=Rotaria sordida TaxID=392033 RepID=A0A815KG96_9BILA|nr:unnamed protein product [Rotaria sordida]CAF3649994.1 unnamed protein product [Rotaria sordida]